MARRLVSRKPVFQGDNEHVHHMLLARGWSQRRTGTRRGVETIVTGLRWRAVQQPLVCRGDWQESFVDDCRELGMAMAAGLEAGIF
jgi:hypothetical protein